MPVVKDPIDEAWDALLESWGSDDAHRKFLAVCETLGRLPDAGRRYRAEKTAGGPRAATVDAHIDRLLARAIASMEVLHAPPSKTPRRIVLAVGTIFTLILFAFAASFFR